MMLFSRASYHVQRRLKPLKETGNNVLALSALSNRPDVNCSNTSAGDANGTKSSYLPDKNVAVVVDADSSASCEITTRGSSSPCMSSGRTSTSDASSTDAEVSSAPTPGVSKKDDSHTYTPLYKAFAPLLYSLAIVGLHHHRPARVENKKCTLPTLSQIYCWTVTIVMWGVVVKSCITLRRLIALWPASVSSVMMLLYFLLQALNATSFLRASHNPSSIRKYFLGFSKRSRYGGAYLCPSRARLYIIVGTVVAWMVILVNQASIFYLMLTTEYFNLTVNDPFDDTQTAAILAMKIVYLIIAFYVIAAWVFPSPVQLSVALIIYKEFTLFAKSLRHKMTKDTKRFTGDLEQERLRFQQMARIVEAADSGLSIHQAASFACNLANICLMLYVVFYYPAFVQTDVVWGCFVFWFFYAVLDISVVITSGILIRSAAQTVTDNLYLISLNNVSSEFGIQLSTFLRRTGDGVGLTVCNLFIIDQTVILSLITALVTYFLVVIQFAATASTPCVCNCTCAAS